MASLVSILAFIGSFPTTHREMFVKLLGCCETTVLKHVFGKMKVCYIVRSPNTRCHPNVLLLEESEVQERLSQSGLTLNNIRQTLVKLWEYG